MKSLLPPLFAVLLSTAGTAYGCHLCGMPPREVELATLLAAGTASLAAGAAVLAARSCRLRLRTHTRVS